MLTVSIYSHYPPLPTSQPPATTHLLLPVTLQSPLTPCYQSAANTQPSSATTQPLVYPPTTCYQSPSSLHTPSSNYSPPAISQPPATIHPMLPVTLQLPPTPSYQSYSSYHPPPATNHQTLITLHPLLPVSPK